MKKSILMPKIKFYLLTIEKWYLDTPERSLDEAYKAALLIKAMEEKHFSGQKIAAESASYGDSVIAYFQSELKKYLKTIRMRLVEFQASCSVVSTYNQIITTIVKHAPTNSPKDSLAIQLRNNPDLILDKLRFIDSSVATYRNMNE
ncbi:MAG: hypothetical protein KME31_33070 [Tolypothrix carrinoi HA7290-LM1]|jgi:hypothetical protein|nr:hypothetical protein [Tolypothrix carrinoi HA7290-LM1]